MVGPCRCWWVHMGSWVPVSLCGCVWSYVSLCSLGVAVCGCAHRLVCVSILCELVSGLFGVHSWTGNCMIILKILLSSRTFLNFLFGSYCSPNPHFHYLCSSFTAFSSFQYFKRDTNTFSFRGQLWIVLRILARPPLLCFPPHSPPVPGFSSSSESLLPRSPCSLPSEDQGPSKEAQPVRTLA